MSTPLLIDTCIRSTQRTISDKDINATATNDIEMFINSSFGDNTIFRKIIFSSTFFRNFLNHSIYIRKSNNYMGIIHKIKCYKIQTINDKSISTSTVKSSKPSEWNKAIDRKNEGVGISLKVVILARIRRDFPA